jgi:hypothetical protein
MTTPQTNQGTAPQVGGGDGGVGVGQDLRPYVTVTSGMRGFFAVLLMWNPDHGGFWEPWTTSDSSFPTPDGAIEDAKAWADAEDLEFRP